MQFKATGKVVRPRGNPGGKVARTEELTPRVDYIEFLRELGPRDGETYLAFECRLAYIQRAREIWIAAWREFGGDRKLVAEKLELARGNVPVTLRRCGLSPELLDKLTARTTRRPT